MTITREEIDALTMDEKQELLDMLWSSLGIEEDDKIVFDNEREEVEEEIIMLQETLAEYRRDPSTAIPWEEVFQKLKERK